MRELAVTGRKVGFGAKEWGALAHDEEKLKQLLAFVRGTAEIKFVAHLVDCDADPFVPGGWAVEEHKKGGLLDLAKTKINLFLTKSQKKGAVVGNELRKYLADQPVLNANVLDYLLEHPELIPNKWKGKAVYFWGTIYRDRSGYLVARCLCWCGSRWGCSDYYLDYGWYSRSPAACGQAGA